MTKTIGTTSERADYGALSVCATFHHGRPIALPPLLALTPSADPRIISPGSHSPQGIMYKILALDGKEYGPVSLEQLSQWIAEGRVNAQTRVRESGAPDWKTAAEFPEIAGFFPNAPSPPVPGSIPAPLFSARPAARQNKALAVTSFVLGLASFVLCLSFLTGIPAIICGHIARTRAHRLPGQFGGAGFAFAGLILGYLSILYTIMLAAIVASSILRHRRSLEVPPPQPVVFLLQVGPDRMIH